MIGFLFGMMFGAMLLGDGPGAGTMQQGLSQIPFRCFKAHELGYEAYWNCRAASMFGELNRSTQRRADRNSDCFDGTNWDGRGKHCSTSYHVRLEFDALTDLRAAIEAKQKEKK
jgi:hypothetical protein